MRILLVEDEKRMADAVSELLRQEKYDVDVYYNGNDGLDAYLTDTYDAAILDVMLPGRSGFEILKKGRHDGIKTPTLMLTAKSDVEDKVHGLDLGAEDYLTKCRALKSENRQVISCLNLKTAREQLLCGNVSLVLLV